MLAPILITALPRVPSGASRVYVDVRARMRGAPSFLVIFDGYGEGQLFRLIDKLKTLYPGYEFSLHSEYKKSATAKRAAYNKIFPLTYYLTERQS